MTTDNRKACIILKEKAENNFAQYNARSLREELVELRNFIIQMAHDLSDDTIIEARDLVERTGVIRALLENMTIEDYYK